MAVRHLLWSMLGVLAVAACDDPQETLAATIEEARACDVGDTCVLAGDTDCTCGQPVNADAVDEVNAAADRVSCCDLLGRCVAVDCVAFANIRCEDGRCTGD
jgi:hypothetical protein